MIVFKTGTISKKEKSEITSLLEELIDIYGDFYITKNNIRLFIKENQSIMFDGIKKGDKLFYDENSIGVIVGYSDNSPRKYLKVLSTNEKNIENIIKRIYWDVDCDLFVKIKKNNPLRKIFENNYFNFIGSRGKEILLVRKNKKQ